MPRSKTPKQSYFPRIREARELLMSKAEELIQLQMAIVKKSMEIGDFETASKANQFLLEHVPADPDSSVRVLDISIDKPKESQGGHSGPIIQLGFSLGGLKAPDAIDAPKVEVKELPEAVIIEEKPEK